MMDQNEQATPELPDTSEELEHDQQDFSQVENDVYLLQSVVLVTF